MDAPPPKPKSDSGSPRVRLAIDAGAGLGLAVALAVVFGLDGRARPPAPTGLETRVETAGPAPTIARPLRLAVSRSDGQYDDMGRLLDQLGEGYRYAKIDLTALEDPATFDRFDVIFLACGTSPKSWLGETVGRGNRPGEVIHRVRADVAERVGRNLRRFVGRGGTLYASDYMFSAVGLAFPRAFDERADLGAAPQTVEARVVDPGLRDVLGERLSLRFDMPGWFPAAVGPINDVVDLDDEDEGGDDPGGPSRETVYLRARYRTLSGGAEEAPLLVKVPYRKGAIIFTSFHNEAQNSESELKLLRYLVFAAVTAQIESEVTQTIVSGGFSPQKRNLLSTSPTSPSVSQSYRNRRAGPLQFVLGFAAQGARLRLTVSGPGGVPRSQEGTSTFTLEVADAAVGDWTYTVEALDVPYPNFPFTLTVAEGT